MDNLVDYVEDQTALIFTNDNPFKLYKSLASSKTPAPLKGGSSSPVDVTVEKGPTSFPPGPIVGSLQQAGIPAAIDGGKVVIKKTETVVHVGDVVSNVMADMLSKLEIFPLEVGLILRAAHEDGTVFMAADLEIDEDKYFNDFMSAVQQGINLSVNSVYPTSDTITTIIASAAQSGTNLGVNAVVYASEVMAPLMAKAQAELMSLASNLADSEGALDEELSTALGAAQAAATVVDTSAQDTQDTESTEGESEEEEADEEEGMAGLGALFG
ncbi:MAG: 50S ribosomal protein L10, partial [Methanosarcinales archaeon]|nr:50S ribosomal protein L10 [Methanosarcinales archaeon]